MAQRAQWHQEGGAGSTTVMITCLEVIRAVSMVVVEKGGFSMMALRSALCSLYSLVVAIWTSKRKKRFPLTVGQETSLSHKHHFTFIGLFRCTDSFWFIGAMIVEVLR